jgi:glutamate racemase
LQSTLPIAVIDSGVGGLSIMKAIHQLLPHESLIYVADSAYAPYGEKSAAEIEHRLRLLTESLIKQSIKALVIACNTATVNAIDALRQQYNFPIIGVEPAIKPAANISKTRKVGVLVTSATAENSRFLALVAKHKQDCEVLIQPCPGLVQMIEQGQRHSAACYRLLEQLLAPLLAQTIDTLVLGCTHYPFVEQPIKHIIGEQVTLLQTAEPVALQLQRQLTAHQLVNNEPNKANIRCYTTLDANNQQALFNELWQAPLPLQNWIF